MHAVPPFFPTRASQLALGLALCLGAGALLGADKKADEKKDKAADPKAVVNPKGVAPATVPVTTNTLPITVPFPKAAFATSLEAGRDPFFPASKRRFPKTPPPPKPPTPPPATNVVIISPPAATNPPPVITTNVVAAGTNSPAPSVTNAPPPPDIIGSANLSLRGIVGTKARQRATVHTGVKSYDFLKGEEMLIRIPNDKQLKVRCVDIRERSAVFQAEGETKTKELFLRDGL